MNIKYWFNIPCKYFPEECVENHEKCQSSSVALRAEILKPAYLREEACALLTLLTILQCMVSGSYCCFSLLLGWGESDCVCLLCTLADYWDSVA